MSLNVPATCGSNLTPVREGNLSRRWKDAVLALLRYSDLMLENTEISGKGMVFTKAGAPVTNTANDSPGSSLCIIIDTTNSDVYLVTAWATTTSFTVTKILD